MEICFLMKPVMGEFLLRVPSEYRVSAEVNHRLEVSCYAARVHGISSKGIRLCGISSKGTRLYGISSKGTRRSEIPSKGTHVQGISSKGARVQGISSKGTVNLCKQTQLKVCCYYVS